MGVVLSTMVASQLPALQPRWAAAEYRGKRVWAVVADEGRLAVHRGLATVRYDDRPWAKVYSPAASEVHLAGASWLDRTYGRLAGVADTAVERAGPGAEQIARCLVDAGVASGSSTGSRAEEGQVIRLTLEPRASSFGARRGFELALYDRPVPIGLNLTSAYGRRRAKQVSVTTGDVVFHPDSETGSLGAHRVYLVLRGKSAPDAVAFHDSPAADLLRQAFGAPLVVGSAWG